MTSPVRIPADVDMADRVLGPLTARQLTILATTGLLLYLGFDATRLFLPLPVFLVAAAPVGVAVTVLALGRRDGVSLDRMLLAAIRQRTTPQHRVAAPEGIFPAPAWLTAPAAATAQNAVGTDRRDSRGQHRVSPSPLRLPATSVRNSGTAVGIVDLGVDGLAVVAIASTLNFALRTPSEQESLVAGFGRYLHSLTAPVQVLVRAERLDLTAQISELRDAAGGLPHPALEDAALEHADYLTQLGAQTDLLRRQVLLILREPAAEAAPTDGLGGPSALSVLRSLTPRRRRRRRGGGEAGARARQAAEFRLARRLGEAVELLAPAGIVVTPLDAGRATAVLGAACNPDTMLPPSAALAGAEDIITTGNTIDRDYRAEDSSTWAAGAGQPRRADQRGTAAHDDPDGFLDGGDEGDDGWAYDDSEDDAVFDAQGRRR
jgi:hypothetical protein